MIIAQYGKKILWYLRKWVLHNLSIGSTLPNTKNFFLAIRWVYYTINGAKEELPTMRPLGIGKHPHTHSKQPVLELSLCFVCVWWNFADFKGQSTAIRLLRDIKAGAKIIILFEYLTIKHKKVMIRIKKEILIALWLFIFHVYINHFEERIIGYIIW